MRTGGKKKTALKGGNPDSKNADSANKIPVLKAEKIGKLVKSGGKKTASAKMPGVKKSKKKK